MAEVLKDINRERKRPFLLDRNVLEAIYDPIRFSPISSIPEQMLYYMINLVFALRG